MQGVLERVRGLGAAPFLTSNSRNVTAGAVFVARKGKVADGHAFIKKAVADGAALVLYSDPAFAADAGEKGVLIPELERELPALLRGIYDLPRNVAAVTGTNGKTSTAFLSAGLFGRMAGKGGFIGTIGCGYFKGERLVMTSKNALTTPDIVELYYLLAMLKSHGVEYVFFEASSIGVEQGRMAGLPISGACFTNLTQDHLDYHGTMEEYLRQKMRLFEEYLLPSGFAVINGDDPHGADVAEVCRARGIRVIDFGLKAKVLQLTETSMFYGFSVFSTNLFEKAKVNLSGSFQVSNILGVLGFVLGFGLSMEEALKFLPLLNPPSGRLERVPCEAPLSVFVDYAHTPDSLLRAIESVRAIKGSGKLTVVFGCGGERDAGKRRIMGNIAITRADFVVVTDDNPRREDPTSIRRAVIEGFEGALNFREIADRKEAIEFAILNSASGDFVLIAGKGHEHYQIIGEDMLPFNDAEVAAEVLAKLL